MKCQVIGTLKVPLTTSVRMLQNKHGRQRVCRDFIKMTTEWKSIESNVATKFILQILVTMILVAKMFKLFILTIGD